MTVSLTRISGWAVVAMAVVGGSAVSALQQAPAVAYVAPSTPIGSGPYKAIMEVDPTLPTHTVYHPANLDALGSMKMPIIVWGNGACLNSGNRFRQHLSEVASHGFLAIALGPIGPPSDEAEPAAAPAAAPAPAGGAPRVLPPPATHTSQLIQAMDWAIAENSRAGSKYRGRLDTSKIAAMGQSCGGVQAIEASADPRVTTSGIWNSGLLSSPTAMGGGKTMTKEDLKRYHGPVLYVSGDESDIAFLNAEDDFKQISHVPVFRAYEKGVGHNGTHRQANGGDFGKVSVAWLKWQLKGDHDAARMFEGAQCGLCTDAKWVVKKKGI